MVNKFLLPFGILLQYARLKKTVTLCAVTLLLLSGFQNAKADTFYWTGTSSTSWNSSSNWYDVSNLNIFPDYPKSGDIAYIGCNGPFLLIFSYDYFTGSNHPTVNATTTCSQIYIGQDKAATLTVSNALTVSNTLQNFASGTINATAAITASGSNATILNAGAFTTTGSNILLSGNTSSFQNSGTGVVSISGATITMAQNAYITNAASGSFTIKGTSTVNFGTSSYFNNSGTFYAGISGSPCTLNMTLTDNAITNNSGGLFYLGSTSVINLTGSHATIANSGRFTFQSDANGSAAVGNISGGGGAGLTGTYNVERFLTGGSLAANRGYRLLSSPVNQTSAATSAANTFNLFYLNQHTYNSVAYAGAFTGGPASTGGGFSGSSLNPTIFLYKESITASNTTAYSGKHVAVIKVNAADVNTSNTADATATISNLTIPIGNGFLMYFVGPSSRTSGSASGTNPTAGPPQDATMTANGYINQGTFTVNLWYTPTGGAGKLSYSASGAAALKGFNMVGNPYPSTLYFTQLYNDNSANIDVIYMLSSRKGGTSQDYVAYSTSGASSPATNAYAVSGAGFIVHVKSTAGTAATLTFNEGQKAPTVQLTGSTLIMDAPLAQAITVDGKPGTNTLSVAQQRTMAMPAQAAGQLLTGLYMKMEKDSTLYSYCGIYYKTDYAAKFEDGDAPYLASPSSMVSMASMTSDCVSTAINHLPDYHNGSRVKLNVGATTTGLYQLKLEGVRNIDTLYDIYLIDHYKKDSLDIRRYGAYNFNLIKTDTSSFGANRFELSIRRKPLPQYLLTDISGAKVDQGIKITWKTRNESNYTGFTLERQDKASEAFGPVYDAQSNGNSVYSFVDCAPNSGNNVYRLKQNDVDGRISYSEPVTVFYDKLNANGLINVFPNPTAEMINVSMPVNALNKGSYKLNVYNSSGNTVLRRTTSTNNWSENIGSLKPGVYIVEVIKNDGSTMGKVKFIKN